MNVKKRKIFLGLLALLLILIISTLFILRWNDTSPERASHALKQYIKHGKIENLVLTIYYKDPSVLTLMPLSVDALVSGSYEHRVIITGNRLREHADLLSRMIDTDLTPVKYDEDYSYVNVRIYYVFESNRGRSIYNVTMWSGGENLFVNGSEVVSNSVFYDVLLPFLPDDAIAQLESYLLLRELVVFGSKEDTHS